MELSRSQFRQIRDHVLLPIATSIPEADAMLKSRLTSKLLREIVAMVPDGWLDNDAGFGDHDEQRAAYVAYLLDRLAVSHIFVEEALHAREQLV